jgi:hypothetical protein
LRHRAEHRVLDVHPHLARHGLRLSEGREHVVDRAARHLGRVEHRQPFG